MTPTADLEFFGETRIAFLGVPEKLSLGEHQRGIVDAKIDAVSVFELRVGPRPGSVSIKDGTDERQVIGNIRPQTGSHSRKGRRRTAARHVEGQSGRPAQ